MRAFLQNKYRSLTADKGFSEILTGTAWAMASRVGTLILSLASSLIIARLYGAEAMGILAIVVSVVSMVTVVTEMGTGTSILRMIPEHLNRYSVTSAFHVYRKTQYLVVGMSLLASVALFVLARPIAEKVFDHSAMGEVIAVASAFILFKSILWLNQQAVRGLKLVRMYAVLQLVPALVLVVFLFMGLPWKTSDVPAYAQLLTWLCTGLLSALIMHHAFRRRMKPDDAVHHVSLHAILMLSLPIMVTTFMTMVIGQSSVLILGMYRSVEEVGYYALAVRLATLTSFMLNAINTMSAPAFSGLYHQGQHDELLRIARKSARLVFWSTLPVVVGLLALGRPALAFFRAEFVVAYPALAILMIGQLFNACAGSTAIFMNMTGEQRVLRNIMVMSAIGHIALNLVLVPQLGMLGAAVASSVSTIVWNGAALFFIYRRFGKTIGFVPQAAEK